MDLNLNSSSKPRKMRAEEITIVPLGVVYSVIAINYRKVVSNLFGFVAPKNFLRVSQ